MRFLFSCSLFCFQLQGGVHIGCQYSLKKSLTMFFVHVVMKTPPLPDTSQCRSPEANGTSTTTTGIQKGCREANLHPGYPEGPNSSCQTDSGHVTSSRIYANRAVRISPYYRGQLRSSGWKFLQRQEDYHLCAGKGSSRDTCTQSANTTLDVEINLEESIVSTSNLHGSNALITETTEHISNEWHRIREDENDFVTKFCEGQSIS